MTERGFSPFHTIGHSTRSIESFVDLLRVGRVDFVVDVRTVPRSRTNPQYNLDSLPAALAGYQIGHTRIAELGGLRAKSGNVPPEVNGFWTNQSFHNYADHALSEAFESGLDQLLALGSKHRCAIMCAESVWWRCHRRIIADYLLLRGHEVFHLMDPGRADPAKMTPGAVPSDGKLTYPAAPDLFTRRD